MMPTLEHDGVVVLFRDNPSLALRVLEDIFLVAIPAHAAIRVADTSLNQLVPVEFRADLVLEVLDADGKFVMAIVLESQREIDGRKKYTWPVYATVSRAERECAAILMVVAVDEAVAAWAEQTIDIGASKCTLTPVVFGPRTIPEITDERAARQDVELALLSGYGAWKRDKRQGRASRDARGHRDAGPGSGDGVFSGSLERAP